MHKGVILLTKASNKNDALNNVNEFMKHYGDGDVWDWYQIGGRWNNTLGPREKIKLFKERFKEIIKVDERGFISQNEIDNKQTELQNIWEECGLVGDNMYSNHYKLPDWGNEYDVIQLSECIETVKEWVQDLEKEKEECFDKLLKAREEAKEGKYDMSGYYAKEYSDFQRGYFCFNSNVYDITKNVAERIPDNVDEYFAVMVDMHN